MAQCPACKKQFNPAQLPAQLNLKGCCSMVCSMKMVSFNCGYCHKPGTYAPDSSQAKLKFCSKQCFDFNGKRQSDLLGFLFTNNVLPGGGQQFTQFLDDKDLARVSQVDTTLNRAAMLTQMGPGYHHDAKHFDARRGEITIPSDEMIEIALGAYRAALKLKGKNAPVVLYRVSDKDKLSHDEERMQTVSGAAKTQDALWPVERTAAWIQGAMRARIPFLLLTDPRGADALVGGRDKNSDAVFVRELFQVTQTRYTIGKSTEADLPASLKGKNKAVFKLLPPDKDAGPLPIIPRMSARMDFHHTWDASKSSLTLADDAGQMSDYLIQQFTEAGKTLGLAMY